MADGFVNILVFALYGYAMAGTVFAVFFIWRGAEKVDQQARGTGLGFRLLILPGCVAFWPLLFKRWLGAIGEPPEERNPHQ